MQHFASYARNNLFDVSIFHIFALFHIVLYIHCYNL